VATSRIADSVGRVLGGRYRLTRPLGTGASSHVYVAEDVNLRRRVAIKVLHPALAGDAAFLKRFRAEAQVVASLRHPNVLTVFDWGEDDGSPYLVMELLEGGSLRSLLDRGALLSPAQAASVGAEAARALEYAHRRGLVHRDIKPANLIFDELGRVRVADFGLARALAEATWTEPAGAVVGTARYAAPEQARGQKLDSRADVYALAVVLVEATTGTVPFAADTTIGTLMARVETPLPVPESTGPLRPVLEAAGTVEPSGRLDAGGLVRALDEVAAHLPPPAPLPLASPLAAGSPEWDEASPTEFPGKTRLFDIAAAEGPPNHTGAGDGYPPPARGGGLAPMVEPQSTGAPSAMPESRGSVPAAGGDAARGAGERESPTVPRRRRWGRVAAAVIAAVVLLAGGVTAYAAESGLLRPSHPVPALVGDTRAQAAASLAGVHLRLAIAGEAYSARTPAGNVLSQTPSTGRVKEGSTVRVVLSRGPAPFPVPGVTGKPVAAATAILRAAHLVVPAPQYTTHMTVPKGYVISQVPAAGEVLPGESVTLTVSLGKPMVAVPALSGAQLHSYAAAQAALANPSVGLVPTEAQVYSDTVPPGQVVGTIPPAGTSVTVGSSVTVQISKGPQLFPVPPVRGFSVTYAAQVLGNAGFQVNSVSGNPLSPATGTYPAQGTMLRKGSSVTIITS
jgi:eukaryotic-like serine/threonine-protein kinase